MSGHNFLVFLQMGGFADYVWSAFGITFFVLTWLAIITHSLSKKIKQQIQQFYASDS